MKTRIKLVSFLVLLLFGMTLLISPDSYAQNKVKVRVELPEGKWTFSARPIEQSQSNVEVYSVTSEADKGLAITKIGVWNRSDKPVGSLKIGWRLLTLGEQPGVLANDETPFLVVAIAPGEWRVIEYPLGTFVNMSRSMLREGKLSGDFRLEVSVTQVVFSDTDSYAGFLLRKELITLSNKLDLITPRNCELYRAKPAVQNDEVFFLNASLRQYSINSAPFCQNQDCSWNGQSGKDGCYMCQGANFFGCQVTSCTSCTSTRCS